MSMYRPIAKYVLRVTFFASVVTAVACATPTAPAPVTAKKPAARDFVDDTTGLTCRSGWEVMGGRYSCGDASF
jgi:hypothetical protein